MKRLVLLGAGHAHLRVLQVLARERPAGVDITLVDPQPQSVYSGMVPGVIAGHYRAADCRIPWQGLLPAAGAAGRIAAAIKLDCDTRTVALDDGTTLAYDLLSIDIGSVIRRPEIPGATAWAWSVRPMEGLLQRAEGLWSQPAGRPLDIVVLGGGAGGVELAMALQCRLQQRTCSGRTTLVAGPLPLLAGHADGVRRRALAALRRWRIAVIPQAAAAIGPAHVLLDGGSRLPCDLALMVTGAQAPAWLRGSGLALDEQGFIRIGHSLQCVGRPDVFAAGDIASHDDEPRPRSGVQAVRSAPVLAHNLVASLTGVPLKSHRPPKTTLYLLSCGDRRAIVSWGRWSVQGRWAWWWKDWIDRRFVDRFNLVDSAERPPAPTVVATDSLNPRA